MGPILGISAYYHDAAAALVGEGGILAAAQEERFSRRKNDERFPRHAVDFCLRQAGLDRGDLEAVVFYDKPITKFARTLETFLAVAPAGMGLFPRVMPSWLSEKLDLRQTVREELPGLSDSCRILFTEHHQAHAASAYYPSPFQEAAILTVDGVGEWATTTLGRGRGRSIELLKELRFPHSLGLLYSAFTAYCGFRVNSGEYKLMGLAPYGEPRYAGVIRSELLDLKSDGSFWLNLDYFHFLRGLAMTNEKFHQLFGGAPRKPESPMEPRYADVARSVQEVTEDIIMRLARHAREVTGCGHLCLAGGVALNCVANGRLWREKVFDALWIQPAAGDAGGALGAALTAWNIRAAELGQPREAGPGDAMRHALLGPEYSEADIAAVLGAHQAVYERLDEGDLLDRVVDLLAREKVVGWIQGRMEFGPRALGNRSILGDPRSPKMQSVMNLKVKFRESFRPFAPVVLRERVADYFELEIDSPYMLLVARVRESLCYPVDDQGVFGLDRLRRIRSQIPAVTHVDYSARIQTVSAEQNPRLYALLKRFEQRTGCGVLVNTSFNVRGEPIVCTPDDAYRCFVNTEMDYLVMGNFLLDRSAQPHRSLPRTHEPALD
ncbi:MAG TPA: carbamoyltransferase [Candidatus Paceibacterota bacterium]|nr:carbamoyltransferase [Verrucomicrobiota bacterium]HRY48001.1 carbamoyltransferase [Candidatus Paceibacterota bacterium]HRZ99297.1 carbamoyltransferase [Candidatus Paceibacterota bacterium]